jgi:hypothetical protein
MILTSIGYSSSIMHMIVSFTTMHKGIVVKSALLLFTTTGHTYGDNPSHRR